MKKCLQRKVQRKINFFGSLILGKTFDEILPSLFFSQNLVCITCSLSDVTCRVVVWLHHPSVLLGAMSQSIVSGMKDERESLCFVSVCVQVIIHLVGRPIDLQSTVSTQPDFVVAVLDPTFWRLYTIWMGFITFG